MGYLVGTPITGEPVLRGLHHRYYRGAAYQERLQESMISR